MLVFILQACASSTSTDPATTNCFHFIHLDSGLSLTTVRDANEAESDHDLRGNNQLFVRESKQYRSMPMKRNNNDSDSDDVFAEVDRPCPLVRTIVHPSRSTLSIAITTNAGLNNDH